MSENEKLLPCPFCGTQPIYGGYPDVQISCPQCRQSIVKAIWYGNDLGTTEAAWNTRKSPTKVSLEKCAEAVTDLWMVHSSCSEDIAKAVLDAADVSWE